MERKNRYTSDGDSQSFFWRSGPNVDSIAKVSYENDILAVTFPRIYTEKKSIHNSASKSTGMLIPRISRLPFFTGGPF